ncbi:hypothetical protein C4E44_01130 [Pseudomonas sp. MWU12-2312b]|nr:hypothetical protein C4E44_01130 [Pseudomonas sp. MWU12-2312b]
MATSTDLFEFKHRPAGGSVSVLFSPDREAPSFLANVGDTVELVPVSATEDHSILVKVEHANGHQYSGRVIGFTDETVGNESSMGYSIGQAVKFVETQIISFDKGYEDAHGRT